MYSLLVSSSKYAFRSPSPSLPSYHNCHHPIGSQLCFRAARLRRYLIDASEVPRLLGCNIALTLYTPVLRTTLVGTHAHWILWPTLKNGLLPTAVRPRVSESAASRSALRHALWGIPTIIFRGKIMVCVCLRVKPAPCRRPACSPLTLPLSCGPQKPCSSSTLSRIYYRQQCKPSHVTDRVPSLSVIHPPCSPNICSKHSCPEFFKLRSFKLDVLTLRAKQDSRI